MFIALNGQSLTNPNPAGPEKYTFNIYNAFAEIDNSNTYLIYFEKDPGEKYFESLTRSNHNFKYKIIKSGISWTQHALSKQLFIDKPDIFFTPIHTLPIVRPTKTKYISMVHGLEFTHIKTGNTVKKTLLGQPERYVCKFSDKLIVPSQATKNAILEKGWANESKIAVVYEGVGKNFYKRAETEITKIREKYKIGDSDYFIFIGTLQPRKNLEKTIEAFSRAVGATDNKTTKLVICGKQGWDYDGILEAPGKYGIEENVIFAGRVPDDNLPTLLSGAKCHVNFSLEEGFGLTLLEAMACEIPCLVSDIPPFHEVCGEFADFCNPYDTESISKVLIKTMSTIDEASKVKIKQAKARSEEFSWTKSGQKTLDIFQSVFKNL